MAVYLYSFGVVSGTLVGTFGVVLSCLLTGGMRGMPGWALGSIVIGIAVGFLVVKSLTGHFLYAQPKALRIAKNLYAFAADVFMLIVSLPVCYAVDRICSRQSSAAAG